MTWSPKVVDLIGQMVPHHYSTVNKNVTHMNTNSVTFTIRLKSSTLDKLKADAAAEDRSVNYIINRILEAAAQPEKDKE
jgi:hypothetical protein